MTIYSLDVLFCQFWTSSFSMSTSNCYFLICIQVFQETGKVVWYSHLFKNFPQFIVIHIEKSFNMVNEAEIDVFLEFPCFVYDPENVGNLISGSSGFSKSSLYTWNFSVHVLLKQSLKDLEHYLASMWNEQNCMVVWTFFGIGMKTDLLESCGHWWVFQICWHVECNTLKASFLWFKIAQLLENWKIFLITDFKC